MCSQGVTAAIKSEDFEKGIMKYFFFYYVQLYILAIIYSGYLNDIGAGHIHRFLSMDQNLLQRTADDVSESITSVSQAFTTLEEASTQLRHIVTLKFDDAVAKDDLASVERFFKIFPMLGLHSDGIVKFANYICLMVRLLQFALTLDQPVFNIILIRIFLIAGQKIAERIALII